METLVIVIHVLVALAIIGLILLQQGKGAETGASFGGGASQTVFGSQGGGNFFSKVTAILAVIFFATSFSLAIIAKNNARITPEDTGIPSADLIQQSSDIPVVTQQQENTASDIPVVTPDSSDVPASTNQ